MADAEDLREAAAALIRKRRNRARTEWHKLQLRGYDSLEELQQATDELYVPATWAGRIGGRCTVFPEERNIAKDDLVPSRKVSVRANTWLIESAASVTSPVDQQILRRPVSVPSSKADYCRFARHSFLSQMRTLKTTLTA